MIVPHICIGAALAVRVKRLLMPAVCVPSQSKIPKVHRTVSRFRGDRAKLSSALSAQYGQPLPQRPVNKIRALNSKSTASKGGTAARPKKLTQKQREKLKLKEEQQAQKKQMAQMRLEQQRLKRETQQRKRLLQQQQQQEQRRIKRELAQQQKQTKQTRLRMKQRRAARSHPPPMPHPVSPDLFDLPRLPSAAAALAAEAIAKQRRAIPHGAFAARHPQQRVPQRRPPTQQRPRQQHHHLQQLPPQRHHSSQSRAPFAHSSAPGHHLHSLSQEGFGDHSFDALSGSRDGGLGLPDFDLPDTDQGLGFSGLGHPFDRPSGGRRRRANSGGGGGGRGGHHQSSSFAHHARGISNDQFPDFDASFDSSSDNLGGPLEHSGSNHLAMWDDSDGAMPGSDDKLANVRACALASLSKSMPDRVRQCMTLIL